MKILLIPVKILLALAFTLLLFISLPLLHLLLGSDLLKAEAQMKAMPVLMQIEQKKQEKKKVEKKKARKISSNRGPKKSRSSSMKFSPDLGVGTSDGVGVNETNLENVVFEEGETDENATPISRPAPAYPQRARDMGIEGSVEVRLLIDRKGKVASIHFVKVPHEVFKKPLTKQMKKWKFKPAMNKGVPVKMWVKVPFEFKLDQ